MAFKKPKNADEGIYIFSQMIIHAFSYLTIFDIVLRKNQVMYINLTKSSVDFIFQRKGIVG